MAHSKPNPTIIGRRLEYFFGRIQNTPTGGLSGTRLDPVSFRRLRNYTCSEQRAPSEGIVVSIGQHQ